MENYNLYDWDLMNKEDLNYLYNQQKDSIQNKQNKIFNDINLLKDKLKEYNYNNNKLNDIYIKIKETFQNKASIMKKEFSLLKVINSNYCKMNGIYDKFKVYNELCKETVEDYNLFIEEVRVIYFNNKDLLLFKDDLLNLIEHETFVIIQNEKKRKLETEVKSKKLKISSINSELEKINKLKFNLNYLIADLIDENMSLEYKINQNIKNYYTYKSLNFRLKQTLVKKQSSKSKIIEKFLGYFNKLDFILFNNFLENLNSIDSVNMFLIYYLKLFQLIDKFLKSELEEDTVLKCLKIDINANIEPINDIFKKIIKCLVDINLFNDISLIKINENVMKYFSIYLKNFTKLKVNKIQIDLNLKEYDQLENKIDNLIQIRDSYTNDIKLLKKDFVINFENFKTIDKSTNNQKEFKYKNNKILELQNKLKDVEKKIYNYQPIIDFKKDILLNLKEKIEDTFNNLNFFYDEMNETIEKIIEKIKILNDTDFYAHLENENLHEDFSTSIDNFYNDANEIKNFYEYFNEIIINGNNINNICDFFNKVCIIFIDKENKHEESVKNKNNLEKKLLNLKNEFEIINIKDIPFFRLIENKINNFDNNSCIYNNNNNYCSILDKSVNSNFLSNTGTNYYNKEQEFLHKVINAFWPHYGCEDHVIEMKLIKGFDIYYKINNNKDFDVLKYTDNIVNKNMRVNLEANGYKKKFAKYDPETNIVNIFKFKKNYNSNISNLTNNKNISFDFQIPYKCFENSEFTPITKKILKSKMTNYYKPHQIEVYNQNNLKLLRNCKLYEIVINHMNKRYEFLVEDIKLFLFIIYYFKKSLLIYN